MLRRLRVAPAAATAVLFSVIAIVGLAATGVAAAALPDGRVWEQVSPSATPLDVIPNATRVRAAADGSKVGFASLTGVGDAHGVGVSSEYMAVRDPLTGTWATHGISPPQEPTGYFGTANSLEPILVASSADLEGAVFRTRSSLTAAPNVDGDVNLYLRQGLVAPGIGSYELLTDAPTSQQPSLFTTGFWTPQVAATSVHLSHVLFESRRSLTVEAPECGLSESECPPLLYEFADGHVRLVGILPASEGGGVAPAAQAGRGALEFRSTDNTLSQDGSRVIFTVPISQGSASGDLYLRDDRGTLDTNDDTSVRINASERATPDLGGPQPAEFWGASSGVDANNNRVPLKVFFTTTEQLTEDDENSSADVYMWSEQADAEGHHLIRLSVDNQPDDGLEPASKGVIGVARDGSYVYFTTTQDQLIAGGPTGGPSMRIFVWHEGTLREVAGLNGGFELDGVLGVGAPQDKAARVSSDGTHIIFLTEGTDEQLTLYGHPAYDQGGGCPSGASPACNEVYVYDATANGGTGDLRCASCNPTGAAATADATLTGIGGVSGAIADTVYQNHPLSDDGRFVFFNTTERLVPEDHNNVFDAYEYDTMTHKVHLLSAGEGDNPSVFLDANPDGHDVFFVTRERLRSSDNNESRDLYDARIGGTPDPGIAPLASCESSESCRSPQLSVSFAAPTSMTFQGGGNLPVLKAPAVTKASKAHKLANALRACKRRKRVQQRKKCESRTRRRYGIGKISSKSGGSK